VAKTRTIELIEYVISTVSVMCLQFAVKLPICSITSPIGRKIRKLMKNEEIVQRFNLNKISLYKYLRNSFDFSANNSKGRFVYSHPALSKSFTASLFRFPKIDKFNLSDLKGPQLLSKSDLLFSILTGYS